MAIMKSAETNGHTKNGSPITPPTELHRADELQEVRFGTRVTVAKFRKNI